MDQQRRARGARGGRKHRKHRTGNAEEQESIRLFPGKQCIVEAILEARQAIAENERHIAEITLLREQEQSREKVSKAKGDNSPNAALVVKINQD